MCVCVCLCVCLCVCMRYLAFGFYSFTAVRQTTPDLSVLKQLFAHDSVLLTGLYGWFLLVLSVVHRAALSRDDQISLAVWNLSDFCLAS